MCALRCHNSLLVTAAFLVFLSAASCQGEKVEVAAGDCNDSDGGYEANWESLDSRPLPAWYDESKFGIFMHLGPYTVPGYKSEWFWEMWRGDNADIGRFMRDNYPPKFTYQDFARELKLEFFDARAIADLVQASGAKYFVFTTKHHDGFTNFPSPYTFGWNSMDVGPKRDVVGELRDAFREHDDLHFGVYYSLFEWYNPMLMNDYANNYKTREYVLNKMLPEMKFLATKYEPEIWWSDGDFALPEFWGSQEFLAWLYNNSPKKDTVVANDRWGYFTEQHHGGFYSGPDGFNPDHVMDHKFEDAFTVDASSWGYRRNMNIEDIQSADKLIATLVEVVSKNGNVLLNVGPTKEGTIAPIFQERLVHIGQWLKVNGDAIYKTKPFAHQRDTLNSNVWYTRSNDGPVYAIALEWPENDCLELGDVGATQGTKIGMLGFNQTLSFTTSEEENSVRIQFPPMNKFLKQCGGKHCMSAYSLKLENIVAK